MDVGDSAVYEPQWCNLVLNTATKPKTDTISGYLYCQDPEASTLLFFRLLENNNIAPCAVYPSAINSVQRLPEDAGPTPAIRKQALDSIEKFIHTLNTPTGAQASGGISLGACKSLLQEHFIPFVETVDGVLQVQSIAEICPPYTPADCHSTNETVLKKLQALLSESTHTQET
eukprot:TRINITY_DN97302_c0_g1_i1.p1 TRINITY_DN97302_c0_g1~~TRINITY_DN97302_c0_g1_i1.p1  ORF type:complete len:183 (-),score=7.74 TRINITY_DN97302_c0_g1_i1:428-946(-)